jgi:hypothetical protein
VLHELRLNVGRFQRAASRELDDEVNELTALLLKKRSWHGDLRKFGG